RRPNNLVTSEAQYGTQTESWQGIDLLFKASLPRNTKLSGGLNSGTSAGTNGNGSNASGASGNRTSASFVVDSPGALRFCEIRPPWRNDVRLIAGTDL